MKRYIITCILIILSILISTSETAVNTRPVRGSVSIGAQSRPVNKDDIPEIKIFNDMFVRVAQSVVPSVVAVIPTRIDTTAASSNGKPNFNNFNAEQDKSHKQRVQALGSGVIVSPSGYILTNYHVISGAEQIDIHLSDGRIFKASVIGVDSLSDVAILKIKGSVPSNLPVAYLGNSDSIHAGDWVAAIGNPFSLLSTITQGIISALDREVSDITTYQNFIQTDAAINPGNSGGALVNVYGEVIGINTLIYSQDGGFMGIGFAIPINMAKKVMEDLIYEGRVVRGWIGLSIQELTNETSRAMGMESLNGVLVSDVYNGQPASKAGLRRGDIIISLNNQDVKNGNDLRNIVASIPPGSVVPVTILRGGKKMHLHLRVIERTQQTLQETSPAQASSQFSTPPDGIDNRIGLSITDLTDGIRKQYNIPSNAKGVIVTKISPSLTDARSMLQSGDLITQARVQGHSVRTITTCAEFQKFTDALSEGQSVLIMVSRSQSTFYVPFEFHNP